MNATARTPDALKIRDALLRFESMGDDSLTWTAMTSNAAGAGTIIPEVGQVVSALHNGVRRFRGHVTEQVVGLDRVRVTVRGPWWWMTRTPLTQVQADSTGTNNERASYIFPTGNLSSHIATLIDRAIANGVPMERGGVSGSFDVPQITLAEMDCASALGELMRWLADGVVFFNYAGALPKIYVPRRGPMSALTIAIPASNVESMSIRPRLDLEVSRVELKYMTRHAATGKPKWASNANGTNVVGKRQIVTISGPEISDALPKDDFDSHEMHTATATAFVGIYEPGLIEARKKHGNISVAWSAREVKYWSTTVVYSLPGATGGGTTYPDYTGPFRLTRIDNPVIRRPDGSNFPYAVYVARPGNIPEWVRNLPGIQAEDGVIHGTFYHERAVSATRPTWLNEMGFTVAQTGFIAAADGSAIGMNLFTKHFSLPVTVIRTAYPAETTVYKPWDYSFLTPPPGLAGQLRAAQAWVPWEGEITTVADSVSGSNLLGRAINVTGALPANATMKALMRGMEYDLMRARVTYELGAPARTDYGSLIGRVRREPKDNIVFL